MKVIYPGSFDPLTYGHLDLIERASTLFDSVVIAVLENPSKKPTFTSKRRVEQIKESTKHILCLEIVTFCGLTVTCAVDHKADMILRGLRAMSDFEYELQIAHTNRTLNRNLETIFLATDSNHSFLSSSVVKEVAKYGGETSHMVPELVAEDLKDIFR